VRGCTAASWPRARHVIASFQHQQPAQLTLSARAIGAVARSVAAAAAAAAAPQPLAAENAPYDPVACMFVHQPPSVL